MAGIIYKTFPDFNVNVRACHIYDPSAFFYGASSGERHGLGLIKLGKDCLTPSMDASRDICCYADGALDFRDSQCPYINWAANGQFSSTGLAVLYRRQDEPSSVHPNPNNRPTRGYYCSRVARQTTKFKGDDYDTYDSILHRNAGVAGNVDSSALYEDTARGSLFYFDSANMWCPTFTALFACRNAYVHGVTVRHSKYDPMEQSTIQELYYKGLGTITTNNYYVTSADKLINNQGLYICTIHPLYQQVTIDSQQYDLVVGDFNMPYSSGVPWGGTWTYVESPWWNVKRDDETANGRVYFLDEYITIHKPHV
jgi:hypothetical protein